MPSLRSLNDTVTCSTIADAMDALGHDGGVTGLRRLTGSGVAVGPASVSYTHLTLPTNREV